MDDREVARHITSLQARMNRMETMMQQLLTIMTTSRAEVDRLRQMQTMLQELQGNPEFQSQERPEVGAIRAALLSGDRLTAIRLYIKAYGVGLKDAQEALDKM